MRLQCRRNCILFKSLTKYTNSLSKTIHNFIMGAKALALYSTLELRSLKIIFLNHIIGWGPEITLHSILFTSWDHIYTLYKKFYQKQQCILYELENQHME